MNSMKKFLRKAGAKGVSKEAQASLAKFAEESINLIAKLAVKNAGHFGRKRVRAEDIEHALKEKKANESIDVLT